MVLPSSSPRPQPVLRKWWIQTTRVQLGTSPGISSRSMVHQPVRIWYSTNRTMEKRSQSPQIQNFRSIWRRHLQRMSPGGSLQVPACSYLILSIMQIHLCHDLILMGLMYGFSRLRNPVYSRSMPKPDGTVIRQGDDTRWYWKSFLNPDRKNTRDLPLPASPISPIPGYALRDQARARRPGCGLKSGISHAWSGSFPFLQNPIAKIHAPFRQSDIRHRQH